ncbi:hypothetical protein CPB85DRAFT_1482585 [Mucidula mucida]|nr:hypothetical protein CPB85DRAFT_1482585 [Mucidula mucida]
MGVELPSSTKLSEEDLEKKLATALTFSQGISSSSKFPLNPTKLSAWKNDNTDAPASDLTFRNSTAEATLRAEMPNPFPLYASAFMDARRALRRIAQLFEAGQSVFVLNEAQEHAEAICMRILNIYKLDEMTPVIVILYLAADRTTPPRESMDFVAHYMLRKSRAVSRNRRSCGNYYSKTCNAFHPASSPRGRSAKSHSKYHSSFT